VVINVICSYLIETKLFCTGKVIITEWKVGTIGTT